MKMRCDAARLGQKIGEEVILLGKITHLSSSGKEAVIETTDHAKIHVAFLEPIDGHPVGYVEVHGKVESKSKILCENLVEFSDDAAADFDEEPYNEMVVTMNLLGNDKWEPPGDGLFFI
ncbi:replication protein A 14 kDa subunit [Cephus cinctus]|uniref:Replication protein A 14 kDa subunit n=1 Tax=Cephus cinctus TaxID=211228 RepID=A0AAJ7FUC8_CEPCN|nr:replication protein A 14 kDa subunit [Cephus cinctus]